MQEIDCIFCNKPNANVVIEENGYTGRQCTCGLIYISPRPSLDEIIDLYGHDDAHLSADAQVQAEYAKRLAAKYHLKLLCEHISEGSLLEIGAGAGYFLDESRLKGFEPYAIELNHLQAEFVRDHHNISCEEVTLENYPDKSKKFNVIYHCDVISHFYEPIHEFSLMHEAMADDGILIFETGNFGDMDKEYYKHVPRFQYPDHLFFFSSENIEQLLDETGFDLLDVHQFSVIPQLHLRALARGLAGLIVKPKSPDSTAPYEQRQPAPDFKLAKKKTNPIRSLGKNSWAYLNHFFRYNIGGLVASDKKPQTKIIIARKRSS